MLIPGTARPMTPAGGVIGVIQLDKLTQLPHIAEQRRRREDALLHMSSADMKALAQTVDDGRRLAQRNVNATARHWAPSTDCSGRADVPNSLGVCRHEDHIHRSQTPATQENATPKLTKAFWLWVHWGDHRGATTQGFQLTPGWHLCHATPTRRKEGQLTQVQLSEARCPDNHQTHEQPRLRHEEFKMDHAQRPWMRHTKRPLSLTKTSGKQGTLDVHEGYSGRGLWRFLCHGDTDSTMKDMPHDMPTPQTPRATIQTVRKESARELQSGGRAHLRTSLRRNPLPLWGRRVHGSIPVRRGRAVHAHRGHHPCSLAPREHRRRLMINFSLSFGTLSS